ncbi:MAG: nucleotidyltransferase domain-containing protein [Planctomycetota bacterium]
MLRDSIVPVLRQYFASHPRRLVAAYLFGSVARGDERNDSDVDIGVVFGCHRQLELADLDRCADMQDELAGLLRREVDVVALDAASPDLQFRVLRDGVLLFEGDREARVEFEIHVRNEYFDLLPYLTRYREAVLRRA